MDRNTRWASEEETFGFIDRHGYRPIAYPVPGVDGSVQAGERQISFAWYDVHRDGLLRETGCLSADGQVLGTLAGKSIDDALRLELLNIAHRTWPEPWRAIVEYAIGNPLLFGTPICEYYPNRLIQGRVALLGDAAHVASPMTGRGFSTGVEDAEALARAFRTRSRKLTDLNALALYERERLPAAQALARSSQRVSAEYRAVARRQGTDAGA